MQHFMLVIFANITPQNSTRRINTRVAQCLVSFFHRYWRQNVVFSFLRLWPIFHHNYLAVLHGMGDILDVDIRLDYHFCLATNPGR